MKRFQLLFSLFLLFAPGINRLVGQKTELLAGTQFPLNYCIGIEHSMPRHFSVRLKTGMLLSPYDQIILSLLKQMGTEKALTHTIGEAFDYGFSIQPEFNCQFKKYYLGVSYSFLSLVAADAPKDLIENYYGVVIEDRPNRQANSLKLNSVLQNIGVSVGKRFHLRNPSLAFIVEFSMQKTVGSRSKLESEYRDFPKLSNAIDQELNQYYVDYGYLPSINVYLLYRLNKQKSQGGESNP